MALGMELYKKKKYNCLKDSDETINFTNFMNKLFDALNRRHPAEEIKINSRDLKVY